jgi:hypothetical protein
MILEILYPLKVPRLIKDYFGIITTTFGRGIIMILFSLIFLSGEHLLHKLCTIFLLLGGICLLCLGLLSHDPDDKNHAKFYPSENNTSQDLRNTTTNEEIPETKLDDSTPRNESIDNNH